MKIINLFYKISTKLKDRFLFWYLQNIKRDVEKIKWQKTLKSFKNASKFVC